MTTTRPTATSHNDSPDRMPPHDLEAEMALNGSVLLRPEVLDDVTVIVGPRNFFDSQQREIFHAMHTLHNEGSRIDVLMLKRRLERDGKWDEVGGAVTLARVSQSVPNAAHALFYARAVRQMSVLRTLINGSLDTLSDAYHPEGQEVEQIVEAAEQRMNRVSEMRVELSTEVQSAHQMLRNALETIGARCEGRVPTGLQTGIRGIDEKLGGLRPQNLVVIGARPGTGKTALAIQIARQAGQQGKVLFFSLEMPALELSERILSQQTGVPIYRMRNGTLTTVQRRELIEHSAAIAQLPLWVDDEPNRTIGTIAAIARREQRRERLALVVIDYMQLITPDSTREPRQEQIARMSRRLKLLARELDVPIIVLCQLNRESEQGPGQRPQRPKLAQLRESGAIEQDADVVILIYHDKPARQDGDNTSTTTTVHDEHNYPAELIVAKNRMGPTGVVRVQWQGETARFVNADHRHGEQEFQERNPQGDLF